MRTLSLFVLASLLGGCVPVSMHTISAETWSENGLYMAFLEKDCKQFNQAIYCSRKMTSEVQWCALDPATNALDCKRQDELNALLNPTAKK